MRATERVTEPELVRLSDVGYHELDGETHASTCPIRPCRFRGPDKLAGVQQAASRVLPAYERLESEQAGTHTSLAMRRRSRSMSIEIRELFERYADRYMAGDAEAVADMYTAPFTAVRNGAPVHLADRLGVVEHLAGLMAAYARSGAAVAQIKDIDLLEQGDRATLATVHWNVRSARGEMIRDFRTSYQLVGQPPRIVSYVNHDIVAT